MDWFKKKQQPLLGIDITTAAIKLLELSKTSNGYKVESYGVAPLPFDILDKSITDVDMIGNAIKAAVKQSGTKLKHAAVAVTGSSVITRKIGMPNTLSDDEIREQIIMDADKYIPYSINEISFDFHIQGANPENPDLVDVLLAASRKETVENRVQALAKAGLKAKVVDLEAFAIENAFSLLESQIGESGNKQTVAIVDIGSSLTTVSVLHNSQTIYMREQTFGGKQLTDDIRRIYGLTLEEAGMAKKRGGLPDNYVIDVLEPFKFTMVQQIQRAIQFFVASDSHRDIDCFILAGGCASIKGVDKMVSDALQTPTYIANPFLNMATSNKIKPQFLKNDAPALMVACGLALRSFD